ncbi:restriction endonuclease [Streptomyces sp. NBC_01233]|uniref:restriction endonuclease n=1 Tax=Streptomyces sp. NBC_01233 TaxID=2903787 RepID=UPI003FA3A58D
MRRSRLRTSSLWVIQCRHKRDGWSGKPVGTRDLHVLNGTGRQVHHGDVLVMLTNGRITDNAAQFAKSQQLHLVDRHLLAEWASGSRPLGEPPARAPPARPPGWPLMDGCPTQRGLGQPRRRKATKAARSLCRARLQAGRVLPHRAGQLGRAQGAGVPREDGVGFSVRGQPMRTVISGRGMSERFSWIPVRVR